MAERRDLKSATSKEAYVPSLNATIVGIQSTRAVMAERPTAVGPTFDLLSATAIGQFDNASFETHYMPRTSEDTHSPMPARPADFSDRYLYPSLAQNERARLTMLWYYTRDLEQDDDLIRRLQDKVDLIKEFIGWEFVICGLVDNDIYKRLVTVGLPLAILPRRESTCSHTILQSSGVSLRSGIPRILPATNICLVCFFHFQHGRRLAISRFASCRKRWPA